MVTGTKVSIKIEIKEQESGILRGQNFNLGERRLEFEKIDA